MVLPRGFAQGMLFSRSDLSAGRTSDHRHVIGTGGDCRSAVQSFVRTFPRVLVCKRRNELPDAQENRDGEAGSDKGLDQTRDFGADGAEVEFRARLHWRVDGSTKVNDAGPLHLNQIIPARVEYSDGIPSVGLVSDVIREPSNRVSGAKISVLDGPAYGIDNRYVADTGFRLSIGALNPMLTTIAGAPRMADFTAQRITR